ncbi:hypothetical protein LMG26857_04989 [Achromobacter anxifer]|jgi:hypothetical protein|uniref:hypothetical protein n=1 Tax=Achromobacter anxifer TaxID=1287737 RepID=UPI00155C4528|nr:hypothetical protein [Achromobacter anxifer]CAB5515921.1 hypothetical protein LMG26857_04989 [Achromobacter anxifer]
MRISAIKPPTRALALLFSLLAAPPALAASAYCEAAILLSRIGGGIGPDEHYRTSIFQVDKAQTGVLQDLNQQWISYFKSIGKYRQDTGERYRSPHSYFCHIAGLEPDEDENKLRTEYDYRIKMLRQNGFPPQIIQWAPKPQGPSSASASAGAPLKPVCEAEIRQAYGPGNADGAAKSISRNNRQLNAATLSEARDSLRKFESMQAKAEQGAQAPMVACLKDAWAQRVTQMSGAPAANAGHGTGEANASVAPARPDRETRALAYGSNQSGCLQRGKTPEGYFTYTNTCTVRVAVGYCNVYAAQGAKDGTVCEPRDSEFSRTKKTFITQDLGLEPGATHRLAYRYETQSTFIVACTDGLPLIESFDTPRITATSKARTACWKFATQKR